MYKAFSPSVLKEMTERGNILLTIKPGWEQATPWNASPSFISYCMGTNREHIFTCYFSQESTVMQVTNIEATKLISDKKSLVDAYMYVALKGLVELAENKKVQRLIVDSFISAAADHMLDLGFYITPKGAFSSTGSRGCKTIEV